MVLLDAISWLDVTLAIADRAGELARAYRRSHRGVDLADFLIAASAEEVNGRLVTRNVKHFPMFPDLEPPY
jgi:predicted nucleic acid-binding protein